MNTNESINHAAQIAQFKFGLIAPVIQDLFPLFISGSRKIRSNSRMGASES